MSEPKAVSLELGDIVSFGWEAYDTGTVCKVHKDGKVDVFRPYTHTANFSCSGGEEGSTEVICYIGFEVIKQLDPSTAKIKLIRKGDPIR